MSHHYCDQNRPCFRIYKTTIGQVLPHSSCLWSLLTTPTSEGTLLGPTISRAPQVIGKGAAPSEAATAPSQSSRVTIDFKALMANVMDSSDLDNFDTDEGELESDDKVPLDDEDEDRQSGSNASDNDDTSDDLRGLVGLQNLGNTCYINAALQALSNCQQLTRFVLDCPTFVKDSGLSRSYRELIHELWNSKNSQYAVPASIIRNIKCIFPAFRGCTQQDAQEFLRCFLEQLHDELKQPATKKGPAVIKQVHQTDAAPTVTANSASVSSSHEDLEDESATNQKDSSISTVTHISCDSQQQQQQRQSPSPLPSSTSSTTQPLQQLQRQPTPPIPSPPPPPPPPPPPAKQEEPRSIISDTFEFQISSSIVCSSCNNISTTKETFKDLSVPIPSRDHPYYQQSASSESGDADEHEAATDDSDQNAKNDQSTLLASQANTSDSESNSSTNDDEDDSLDGPSASRGRRAALRSRASKASGDECKELQTASYLDVIPLARWFLNWFSQLGNWFWGPQISLYDCLSVFFGTDPLDGDNQYSCEICTKKNRGVKYLKILELPEILCIHFKRYESVGSAKITSHVTFPLEGLDLEPFMSADSKPQCTTYNLIACICHHGSALLTGHYTTYALNCYDDQWYEFDDHYVTCVSGYQVENSEAYILFYQKTPQVNVVNRKRR